LPRKKVDDSELPQYVKSIRKDVDARLTDLKSEMDVVQRRAVKKVKEEPLLALGVAFIVGVAVGIALANAGD